MPTLAQVLARPSPEAAPLLLGAELRCRGVRALIAEAEAYHSEKDLACHASRGCTPRSQTLYARAGTVYVYLCYGIHEMLNIVCGPAGEPSAVLVRGIRIQDGEELVRERRGGGKGALDRLCNGPGKVTQALGVDRASNGLLVNGRDCPIRLRLGTAPGRPRRGPRVGVDYAGAHWAGRPWRFWLPDFPVVRPG